MNYFDLYDLPVTLTVDPQQLKQRYYTLSRQYHPDMHTTAEAAVQAAMLEKAAAVNKGFKILGHPSLLLQYVLQLKGLLEDESKYQLPPAFLMEMMEINEKMMELEFDPDTAAMDQVRAEVVAMENALEGEVAGIIRDYDDATVSAASLDQLRAFYFKKKYVGRIKERLHVAR